MSININHFINKENKFILSASAEIEYEKDKCYKLGLQVTDCRTKNPLSYNDTLLKKGKGIVKIDFDNSAYMEDGITVNVTAAITEVPPSPEPQSEPASHPETESVPADKIIDSKSERYTLFGLYNCLNHIDFQQSLSYKRDAASLTFQSLEARADISLKTDYYLESLVKSSANLTYISTDSKSVTPKWDITTHINQIAFRSDSPDKTLTCGFSGFCFNVIGLIKHKPSGLILPLRLILDNR